MRLAFYVTGSGRCGTKWLAALLDESDHGMRVYHAPLHSILRRNRSGLSLRYPKRALRLLAEFEEEREEQSAWGAVGPFVRFSVEALAAEGIRIAGLVRDGRRCVQSLKCIMPHLSYEQACNWWVNSYEALLASGTPIFHLESLNSDFDSFRELCDLVGCACDRETWQRYAGLLEFNVRSKTVRKRTRVYREVFRDVAGDLQEMLGYPPMSP